jgi:hypothetical protein
VGASVFTECRGVSIRMTGAMHIPLTWFIMWLCQAQPRMFDRSLFASHPPPIQAAAPSHGTLPPEVLAQRLARDLWTVGDVDALYGASIVLARGAEDEDGPEGEDGVCVGVAFKHCACSRSSPC